MSLLELYGAPVQIRTSFVTRQHPDCIHPRREVQCPTCKTWSDLTHNSFCTSCNIWLVDEQPAPAAVVTEPVAEVAAEPVETLEQVAAGIEHIKDVLTGWDTACEEPFVAPNEELSQETLALCAADTTVLNLDEPLALEQPPFWMQSENACEAKSAIEASTEVEPMDEQDALIAELAFEADAQPDRERYFAARSGKYVLLHLRESGMAVNCSCPDRVKKGRFQGRCCKHMTAHNAMLQPATRKQEAA